MFDSPARALQTFEKIPPHPLIYASFVPDGPYTEGLERFDLIRPHNNYTIGRDNAHFLLEVENAANFHSSRNHCEVIFGRRLEESCIEIFDFSTNGILVNGKRIEPRSYRRLENGETVIFGPPEIPVPDDKSVKLRTVVGSPPRHYRYVFLDFTSPCNFTNAVLMPPPGLTERQLAFRASYEEYDRIDMHLQRMRFRLSKRYPDYFPALTQDSEPYPMRVDREKDPFADHRDTTPVLEIPPPLDVEECKKITPEVELLEDRENGAPHIYHGDVIWRGKVYVQDVEDEKRRAVSEVHLWSFVYGLPLVLHPKFEEVEEDLYYTPPEGDEPRRNWKLIRTEARHEQERKGKGKGTDRGTERASSHRQATGLGSPQRKDEGSSSTDASYALPPPVALVDGPTRSGVVAVTANVRDKRKRKADSDEAADTSKMPPPPAPVKAHAPSADTLPPKKKRKSSPGSSHLAPKDSTTSSALSTDPAESSASDSSGRRTLRSASKRA